MAGRPDGGRRALDVAEYLAVVDRKSLASVKAGGPPVAHVYAASDQGVRGGGVWGWGPTFWQLTLHANG